MITNLSSRMKTEHEFNILHLSFLLQMLHPPGHLRMDMFSKRWVRISSFKYDIDNKTVMADPENEISEEEFPIFPANVYDLLVFGKIYIYIISLSKKMFASL